MFLVQIVFYNLLSTQCHRCRPMLLPSLPTAATPFFIVDAITLTSHCHRHCHHRILLVGFCALCCCSRHAVLSCHRIIVAIVTLLPHFVVSLPSSPHFSPLLRCCLHADASLPLRLPYHRRHALAAAVTVQHRRRHTIESSLSLSPLLPCSCCRSHHSIIASSRCPRCRSHRTLSL